MNSKPDISLNLMPAFYNRRIGLKYGEGYYFDPEHRARVECAEARFQYECWGRFGAGMARPQPSAGLFIQPVDLIMRTQGAEWRLPEDAVLESWGKPWAGMTVAAIRRIDPRAAAAHPVIDSILDQYRQMRKIYGERAGLFGLKDGVMSIHSPYTTALQLIGADLFLIMEDDPAGAAAVFDKVWELYRAIYSRLQQTTGFAIGRINIGDCSASMLSEQTYRAQVLPVNRRLTESFGSAGYHSCGLSDHLLEAFAEIPRVDTVELGAGTDLKRSVALMPRARLCPLVDPTVIRDKQPDDVRTLVGGILKDAAGSQSVTLCAWSFDRDTPIENVTAIYEAAAIP